MLVGRGGTTGVWHAIEQMTCPTGGVGPGVVHAEMQPAGGGRYTVDLKGEGPRGLPRQAVYRDYAAFRELTLTLDRADEAQPFPPDTWSPGGR